MTSIDANTQSNEQTFADELKPGTSLLRGQYVIDRFLNSGGFGMTYLARDSLERAVVIKECFPASLCRRQGTSVRARTVSNQDEYISIVRLFVQEARRLSKLQHPNIVGVHQVFEDNHTAYMALDFVDGDDLLDIVDDNRRKLGPAELRQILLKVLDAISFIHDQNILHRDISPDNILLDKSGEPVLIDFGAAREQATKASRAVSGLIVVKDGYSPQEFYVAGSAQGRSSDLYALAATFYHMVQGEAPVNSQTRLAAIAAGQEDPYRPITKLAKGYDDDFLSAIDNAMNMFPEDRTQTAQDWIIAIDQDKRRAAALATARKDTNIDKSISKLVFENNRAVLEEAKRRSAEQIKTKKLIEVEAANRQQEITKEKEFIEEQDVLAEQELLKEQESFDDPDLPDEDVEQRPTSKGWWFARPNRSRSARRFWII